MTDGPVIPVSALDDRLAKVQAELTRLAQQARDLEIERDMLVRLRQFAVVPDHGNRREAPAPPPPDGANVANVSDQPVRLPTAQAVYHILQRHPGLRQFEVVNEAVEILDSSSNNKRRLLFSAISGMKRRGRIRQDAQGGLYAANGTGQEQMPLTG